jgi:hypothetical protein
MEYSKGGRWRHIPIDMDSSQEGDPAENHQEEENAEQEHKERLERKVRVEQRRTTREGMDLGEYGTKEEAACSWKYGGHGQVENVPKNVETSNVPNGQQHGRRHSSMRHSRNVTNEAGNEGWREPPHLPRLAINRDGMISRNGRIRSEWRERDGIDIDRVSNINLSQMPTFFN